MVYSSSQLSVQIMSRKYLIHVLWQLKGSESKWTIPQALSRPPPCQLILLQEVGTGVYQNRIPVCFSRLLGIGWCDLYHVLKLSARVHPSGFVCYKLLFDVNSDIFYQFHPKFYKKLNAKCSI